MKQQSILLFILLLFSLSACGGEGKGAHKGKRSGGDNSTIVDDAINLPKSTLTPEIEESIAYMYSEEKLARELYLNLYALFGIKQLYNIPNNSEIEHVDAMNRLAIKYDLNITQYPETMPPYDALSLAQYGNGQFPVEEVQSLYDILYDKGMQSQEDALAVGCMVEVTDVEDLNRYLALTSDAPDVVEIFNFLRDGSYNHYWAFDKGLKDRGVSEGCCGVGEEYCHPEYPED